ncbi:DUF4280 domain-containing protein [Orenia marismortui]|uniref:Uncharacterized protein DUF4280 n=1 Tax=Orenia marismortui TaxID=46469 RepID=A0A4R8HL30_9FIRM|nr:DUF4280 domain-containing protein [Orenia marismortui]TDX58984.1 uncharacterized protein DUF4280 [Orenia marismortui]
MGVLDIDVPPIPGKEGTYEYDNGNIIYKVKGQIDGTVVAPYIPPKRKMVNNELEDLEEYNKRITADVNRVIDEIETNKDQVDNKARKHAINSTYELGDTGLTFASAFKKAEKLFSGSKGELTKKDISIPGIMVKSANAGMEEIKRDIVGDLEEGFSLGDFFAKYGPALNEAIWTFGYGYGKNGLTNRHLLYMVYLVKKNNILNAFAAEIMEMTMVKGLYILHEAILVSNPNIRDKDGFFKKVKKYTKAVGKETMDLLRAIQGLFWIFISGAVSDLIKEKVDNTIFSTCDEAIMGLLDIKEDNKKSIEKQEINKDYTENFEEVYNKYYQQLDQVLKTSLAKVKNMEIDLGEELEDTFGDFLEKLKNRYSIISKIFGADKAYTVYNMQNIGDDGIKVVKEEKIDGPGIGYGSKIVIGEGAVQWGNVQLFSKFQKKSKRKNIKPRKGSSVTEVFAHLAVNTKEGNYVTRQVAQAGVLATQLNFLRKDLIFTEKRETKFEGLLRLHGDIDDISALVQNMIDNGIKIENISDFVAYFDEEGKRELEEYIKDLESDKSNNTSLSSPKRERYAMIIYEGEKKEKDGEVKARQITIGYPYKSDKTRVDYVELLIEKLSNIYDNTKNTYLTSKNSIIFGDRTFGGTIDCDLFRVKKIKLSEVAKEKGVVELEKRRGRLKSNQEYIGDFISIEEVIKYNNEHNKGPYKVGISPRGDYLILYMASSSAASSTSVYLFGNLLGRFILGSNANDIKDVKFPYEEYIANNSIFYGSANKNDLPEGTQDKFEFWVGTNHSYSYTKRKNNNLEESEQKVSNPNGKIIINGEEIGISLSRIEKGKKKNKNLLWRIGSFINKVFSDNSDQLNYRETIKKDDGRTLELIYTYKFGFSKKGNPNSIIGNMDIKVYPSLRIEYRYIGYGEYNHLVIKDFSDGDYGINIPDKGEVILGTRFKGELNSEGIELDNINIDEIVSKGRGKVKIDQDYIKAQNLNQITEEDDDNRWISTLSEGDTLWDVAVSHFGDGSRWRELEKEDGSNFSEEETENLPIGTKVYGHDEDSMEIKGYQDQAGRKYTKDAEGNLYITYLEEDNRTETLSILGFQEGDYGLWIANQAPYYLEDGEIIRRSDGEKGKQGEVLGLEENKFLKEEERIKEDFLWIYAGEKIVFPKEQAAKAEQANQEEKSDTNNSSSASWATNTAVAAKNSEDNNKIKMPEDVDISITSSPGSKGSTLYVCSGAKLQCNQGDQEGSLTVVAGHNIKLQDNLMASIMDNQPMTNISPFGKCKSMSNPTVAAATAANHGHLKPMPCQPNIVTPWINGKMNVKVAGNPALLECSKLNCAYAGIIKITDPAQDLVKG